MMTPELKALVGLLHSLAPSKVLIGGEWVNIFDVAASAIEAMGAELERVQRSFDNLLARDTDNLKKLIACQIERDALRLQVEALAKDAARYRWLGERATKEDRDSGYTGFWRVPFIDGWNHTPYAKARGEDCDYQTFDAAVDAAMTPQRKRCHKK